MKINAIQKLIYFATVLSLGVSTSQSYAEIGGTKASISTFGSARPVNIGNLNAGAILPVVGLSIMNYHGGNSATFADSALAAFDGALGGRRERVLEVSAEGDHWYNTSKVTWRLNGWVKVMGTTVAVPTYTESTTAHIGDTGVRNFDKKFFDKEYEYDIAGVGITGIATLSGKISARAYNSHSTLIDSVAYNSPTSAYVLASGTVKGTGTGKVNIPFLASAGLKVDVALINGWVTENTGSRYMYFYNAAKDRNIFLANVVDGDAGLSVGGGRAYVFFDSLFYDDEATIASWSGVGVSSNLFENRFSDYYAGL